VEVSQFELIYKPQSPVGTADTVLQGYFLNITNLETEALSFRLDFVTSSVSDPDRSLAGNTIAIVDTPNANNQPANLVGVLASASFRLSPNVTIPGRGTAKIAILPSDPFPTPVTPANFEARGYVTLRLPALFSFQNGSFRLRPQLDRPAKVLLTAQNRATYLGTGGAISDQTQASVPIGDGAAKAEVAAETGFFPAPGVFTPLMSGDTPPFAPEMGEDELALALAVMSGASDAELDAVNATMDQAGLGMALVRGDA
jgi:hypothetical protein